MLWFKNLMIYRLSREIPLQAEQMEQQLTQQAFTPCSSQDMTKTGWIPVTEGTDKGLVYAANGQLLICARKEEKILPAPVVKQALADRISRIEADQRRKLKKTEKDALKDDVLHGLLTRAFSRFQQTWLWIDARHGLIIIDCASAKKAEDVLALLRKSLGSLPVIPLTLETPAELTLTRWVRTGELPDGFQLMDEAELKSVEEDGGVIRCKKQELVCDEIAAHIEAGKQVTKLALDWQQRVQFIFAADGSLKRLKFADTLQQQNDDIDREDKAQRFDADFTLMSAELTELLQQLIAGAGGEAPR